MTHAGCSLAVHLLKIRLHENTKMKVCSVRRKQPSEQRHRFSAASNAALNGFCFQETRKTQSTFIYLVKQLFLQGADLSEIAPNDRKGRVCSRSPSFGRIPMLLCRVFIDFSQTLLSF